MYTASCSNDRSNSGLSVPHSTGSDANWPDLVDLEEPAIARLPDDLLSGWYADMAKATAAATETPLEMAVMVVLGALATVNQRKYDVQIEPGYTQPLNLYLVPIMEPGNRKSGVIKLLMSPIYDFESRLREKKASSIRTAKSEFDTAQKRIELLRGQAAKNRDEEAVQALQREIDEIEANLPTVPSVPQLVADDATPESICRLLAENDERLTISSAEPEVFEMMLGRYSKTPNLGIYLKSHDGDLHKENRKSSSPVSISAPLLTIVVMAQPDAIEALGKERIMTGRGMLQRFLFVMPPSPIGTRLCERLQVPPDVEAEYARRLNSMLALPIEHDDEKRPKPRVIKLSQEAYQLWKAEERRVESDQNDGNRLVGVKGWAGKFPAAIARIAANLHVANCVILGLVPESEPLPHDTMKTAVELSKVIESHTLVVFGQMQLDDDLQAARKIIREIRRRGVPIISRRDCARAERGRKAEALESVFAMLIEYGYIRQLTQSKSSAGRPSEKFEVNPLLLRHELVGTRDKKDDTSADEGFGRFVPQDDEFEPF